MGSVPGGSNPSSSAGETVDDFAIGLGEARKGRGSRSHPLRRVAGAKPTAGLFTRVASLSLLIDMPVALASTKVSVLLGRGYGGFVAVGAGAWSCDERLVERGGTAKVRRGEGA